MKLSVVTPESRKVDEDVQELTAPGSLGELGILSGHIPIFTVLDVGVLTYVQADGNKKTLAIGGGFLQVNDDTLAVLTETAEFSEEIDVSRASDALKRAEQDLAEMDAGSDTYQARRRAMRRAENRLSVAKR